MKAAFLAALLFGSAFGSVDEDYASFISHDFAHFSVHHTPKSKASQMMNSRWKRGVRKSDKLEAEVEGYKVEFFQYISVVETSYSENITQFGTWYKDLVTNDTRTEVVTYSLFNAGNGDRYYTTPAEYLDISGQEYQILEADSQYVYCETATPSPSENIEFEELGYAFIVPDEQAFAIIWGYVCFASVFFLLSFTFFSTQIGKRFWLLFFCLLFWFCLFIF